MEFDVSKQRSYSAFASELRGAIYFARIGFQLVIVYYAILYILADAAPRMVLLAAAMLFTAIMMKLYCMICVDSAVRRCVSIMMISLASPRLKPWEIGGPYVSATVGLMPSGAREAINKFMGAIVRDPAIWTADSPAAFGRIYRRVLDEVTSEATGEAKKKNTDDTDNNGSQT